MIDLEDAKEGTKKIVEFFCFVYLSYQINQLIAL